MEPATSPIWTEAIRTLEEKGAQRTEFEKHVYDRLVELETLIAKGNEAVANIRGQLAHAEQSLTKACGAYENMSDMLAAYYVKTASEKMRGGKDEETDETDNVDGKQPDNGPDEETPQASS